MSSFSFYLLLSFVPFILPVLSADCKPHALSLPFKSQRLVDKIEARGVLWKIGGPDPQNITLMPSAWYNDTYLWGASFGFCPSWTNAASCIAYRGGLYNRTVSESENDVANMVPHIIDGSVANWTKDDIRLQDNTSLPQFEFARKTYSDNPFTHIGELGLGRSSTFLKTLFDSSKISSKSYSFFWGNEVTDEPRDGSLTLGGYDQALIENLSNITVPFTDEAKCREGLVVSLTSLGLQTSGGTTRDAWEGLPDLKVCVIAATSNIMMIPAEYWDPIESIMGVERYPYRNGTAETHYYNTTTIKPPSSTYKGNMSISINDQLTVTLPNNQLIFDEHFIASSGLLQSKTDVRQVPIVRIRPGDGAMPRLGGMFFSSAYLMVNHDKKEFTISQVQPKSAPSKIMAFDTANNCIAPVAVAGASTTPDSPSSTNGANGTSSSKISKGLSGGAIAGIVVGVVGGIAIIAVLAFIFWRRRRSAADQPSELSAFAQRPPAEKYAYHATELQANSEHELMVKDANQYAHELDGAGRPMEVTGVPPSRGRDV